jgi:hypothetical protein
MAWSPASSPSGFRRSAASLPTWLAATAACCARLLCQAGVLTPIVLPSWQASDPFCCACCIMLRLICSLRPLRLLRRYDKELDAPEAAGIRQGFMSGLVMGATNGGCECRLVRSAGQGCAGGVCSAASSCGCADCVVEHRGLQ